MRIVGKWRLRRYSRAALFAVATAIIIFGGVGTTYALTSSSNNYQITESEFNAGSTLDSCSSQYCAQATIGDPSNPTTSSSASFSTGLLSDEPVLEMIVTPGESNLGVLSTQHTATKTTTIKIRSYLSDGYLLQIVGDPPKFDGHFLETSTATEPVQSVPGTEQFGINVVANTNPTVGADPVQDPADQGTFGEPASHYGDTNLFKYISGDTIAHNVMKSGSTTYTVSMIINISSSTPAGHYATDFSAVMIPAF